MSSRYASRITYHALRFTFYVLRITSISPRQTLGLLDRPQRGRSFIAALIVLVLGRAVSYHAAGGLGISHAILNYHRTQRDADIQIAVEADMSASAGINLALRVLQLGDDLHGAN